MRIIYLNDVDEALNELMAADEWKAALELISENFFRPVSFPLFGKTRNETYVHERKATAVSRIVMHFRHRLVPEAWAAMLLAT
jgi:hypothetical protein